jgi:ribosomal protein L32
MFQQSMARLTALARHYFTSPFTQQIQPLLIPSGSRLPTQASPTLMDVLSDNLWFAVPKKKVTRSKKRMKTTRQKRIKLKKNIIVDPRTGETTLMHKLPFNWKDYLPKTD